jgi:hypothetical protein
MYASSCQSSCCSAACQTPSQSHFEKAFDKLSGNGIAGCSSVVVG